MIVIPGVIPMEILPGFLYNMGCGEFHEILISYEECITWTTDGFYRETQEMVHYRLSEGCSVVEMECAAIDACAQKREALFGQFFFYCGFACKCY